MTRRNVVRVGLVRSRCACERQGRRLPEHQRDLPGSTDPLARGERRLEACEGTWRARRAARAEVEHLLTRRHRNA